MRVSYKIIGLIPIFGLVCGCSLHRGVISYIDDKKITVKDIDLGKEKTIVRDTTRGVHPSSKYVYAGDTIYIETSQYNKDTLFVGSGKVHLRIDCGKVKLRQTLDSINSIKKKEVLQPDTCSQIITESFVRIK